MAIFTVCHYAGQLPITIALFHLQLNYGMILMQKLKIHQFYPFLSQNLKKQQNVPKACKHYIFGNRKENIYYFM